jgi:putative transposase
MQRLQAFKYELMPDGEQQRKLRRYAGACRFVFNEALALQKARYERGEGKLGYAGLCRELTAWRAGAALPSGKTAPWLSESPVHPLQQSLKDLERAYQNFFARRADFPRFKKKGAGDSMRYPDAKQFKIEQANARVFLPKLGWMRLRLSRKILGTAKNITVSCTGQKWFASIQTGRDVPEPVHPQTVLKPVGNPVEDSAIGVDVGIARFATLHDGRFIAPLGSFKKHQQRLARYQRAMSRKKKFSNNWKKALQRVRKLHTRIAHVRHDFLHKATTTLSQNHALVCIEDLQVRNMSRSGAGTPEAPGKRVRAKAGLNRAILDQGWAEFRRQLEYKLAWTGGSLVVVPPHHTSQTAGTSQRPTARHRRTSPVWRAGLKAMPMWLGQ